MILLVSFFLIFSTLEVLETLDKKDAPVNDHDKLERGEKEKERRREREKNEKEKRKRREDYDCLRRESES